MHPKAANILLEACEMPEGADLRPAYRRIIALDPTVDEAWVGLGRNSLYALPGNKLPAQGSPLVKAASVLLSPVAPAMSSIWTRRCFREVEHAMGISLPGSLCDLVDLGMHVPPSIEMRVPYETFRANWPRFLPFARSKRWNDMGWVYGLYYDQEQNEQPIVVARRGEALPIPVASSFARFLLLAAVDSRLEERLCAHEKIVDTACLDDECALATALVNGIEPEQVIVLREACSTLEGTAYSEFILKHIDDRAPFALLALGKTEEALAVCPDYAQAYDMRAEQLCVADSHDKAFELLAKPRVWSGVATACERWRTTHASTWNHVHEHSPTAQQMLDSGLKDKDWSCASAALESLSFGNSITLRQIERAADGSFDGYPNKGDAETLAQMNQAEKLLSLLSQAGCTWPQRLWEFLRKLNERIVDKKRGQGVYVCCTIVPPPGDVVLATKLLHRLPCGLNRAAAMRLVKNGGVAWKGMAFDLSELYTAAKVISRIEAAGGTVDVELIVD